MRITKQASCPAPSVSSASGGGGTDVTPAATGRAVIPVINDDFTDAALKPFWDGTQLVTSGDWGLDAANDRLEGLATNNQRDWYRQGIEGDADHQFKVEVGASDSLSIYFIGNAITVKAEWHSNNFNFLATGRATVTVAFTPAGQFWIRLVRQVDDLYMYYKVNDGDDWTLIGSHLNLNLGHDMSAELDSAANSYIYRAVLYDNSFTGSATKAKFTKEIALTDAATIAVDASKGNLFTVTLGGNRTLGAPTNPKKGQMIVFRIKQDATGSRTLSFNAIYRFSTDIPSPTLSTGAGDEDYLGFIYNDANSSWDCIGKVFGF